MMNEQNSTHAFSDAKLALHFCARLGLWVTASLGMLGVLSLAALWELPGHSHVSRGQVGLLLLLLGVGAWFGRAEPKRRAFWRRLAMVLSLASLPLWKLWLRQGAPLGALLWLLALFLGLSAGAELYQMWLWNRDCGERQPVLQHPLYPVWTLLLAALSLALLPYFGVVVCGAALAGQALCWRHWAEAESVPRGWFLQLPLASILAVWGVMSLFGVHLSSNEYWAVDQWKLNGHTYRIERLRKHGVMMVKGPGNLFFSTEAHRWSEALVHPTLNGIRGPARVLLLGGETGFALREILRYPHVKEVHLWTARLPRLHIFSRHPLLKNRNQKSLQDPRVRLRVFADFPSLVDAVQKTPLRFSRIVQIVDHLWARNARMMYEAPFLRLVQKLLQKDGRYGISTGLLQPVREFGCFLHELRKAGWKATPYRAFGLDVTWGFVLAGRQTVDWRKIQLPRGLRHVTQRRLVQWFSFPRDQQAALRSCPPLPGQP